jgi:hypothetical protein
MLNIKLGYSLIHGDLLPSPPSAFMVYHQAPSEYRELFDTTQYSHRMVQVQYGSLCWLAKGVLAVTLEVAALRFGGLALFVRGFCGRGTRRIKHDSFRTVLRIDHGDIRTLTPAAMTEATNIST